MRLVSLSLVSLALVAGCKPSSGGDAVPPVPPSSTAPVGSAPQPPAGGADVIRTDKGDLTIHPVYHATLWLEFGGKIIVLDPWSKAEGKLDAIPKADFVFVTDIHSDHYDPPALAKVKKPGTVVVAPKVVAEKETGATLMSNGDKKDFGAFSVEAIPMYNLKRGPEAGKLFHDKGRGNGYVFTFGDKRVYVSGDTECVPEIKALPSIDVAFLCMNLPYTMPPSEAGECVRAFKPKVLYPYHFRDSNPDEMGAVGGTEVRKRGWY